MVIPLKQIKVKDFQTGSTESFCGKRKSCLIWNEDLHPVGQSNYHRFCIETSIFDEEKGRRKWSAWDSKEDGSENTIYKQHGHAVSQSLWSRPGQSTESWWQSLGVRMLGRVGRGIVSLKEILGTSFFLKEIWFWLGCDWPMISAQLLLQLLQGLWGNEAKLLEEQHYQVDQRGFGKETWCLASVKCLLTVSKEGNTMPIGMVVYTCKGQLRERKAWASEQQG